MMTLLRAGWAGARQSVLPVVSFDCSADLAGVSDDVDHEDSDHSVEEDLPHDDDDSDADLQLSRLSYHRAPLRRTTSAPALRRATQRPVPVTETGYTASTTRAR